MGYPLSSRLTKAHFSCRVYKSYLLYIRKHFPNVDLDQIAKDAGLSLEYIENESNFVSTIFDYEFTRRLLESTGDPELCYKVGAQALCSESVGASIHFLITKTFSVSFILRLLPKLTFLFSKVTQAKIIEDRTGFLKLHFSASTDELNFAEIDALKKNFQSILSNTIGHYASVSPAYNEPPAQIEVHSIGVESDIPVFEISVFYQETSTYRRLVWPLLASLLTMMAWYGNLNAPDSAKWSSLILSLGTVGMWWALFYFNDRDLRKKFSASLDAIQRLDQRYSVLLDTKKDLDANRERLQLALNASSAYVWEWDILADEMRFDDKGIALIGLDLEVGVIKPRGFLRRIHKEDRAHFEEGIQSFLSGSSSSFKAVFRLLCHNDSYKWIQSEACVTRNEKSKPLRMVGWLRDITEEREKEKRIEEQQLQLFQSSKMSSLGEMAAGIAHEINNPLTIIMFSAEDGCNLVEQEKINQAQIRKNFSTIMNTSSRIAKIIKSLRSFSRNESLDPTTRIPLIDLLDDTLRFCGKRILVNNVNLQVHAPRHMVVECRPSEISQVILNLINNAIDSVEQQKKPWIEVVVQDQIDFAEIEIRNSGPVIPEEVRPKLFESFFTTKPKGKGTGLGLSLSKQLIEHNGGKIWYDSESETPSFKFRVPLAKSI